MKSFGLTKEVLKILFGLRMGEGNGIPGVRVKSVEIGRNTSGEGGSLAQT